MKKSLRTISAALTFMAIAVLTLAFTACSNDDEPKTISGEEMLENIEQLIEQQAKANRLYKVGEQDDNVVMVVDSKEIAHQFCESLILGKWDGKQCSVKLPDECGLISIIPSHDESYYYTVALTALKNTEDMRIVLAPMEYLKSDNSSVGQQFAQHFYKCQDCGWYKVDYYPPKKCKKCKSKNIKCEV